MLDSSFRRSRSASSRRFLRTLLETATRRRAHVAVAGDDHTATYGDLLESSALLGSRLLDRVSSRDLRGARVGLLMSPGAGWVSALLGIWRAGGHAVPLALTHPEPELEHVLTDAEVTTLVVEAGLRDRTEALADRLRLPILVSDGKESESDADLPRPLPDQDEDEDENDARFALLLYTSGTTGKPKGVPIRHRHLGAQVRSLSEAWRWSEDDHILGVLPLHHTHGIVNVVLCALWNGASCTLHRGFDVGRVWRSVSDDALTLFMAVPTIYRRLIEEWQRTPELRRQRSDAARRLRLMVSGSAALPDPTLHRWREISGQTLLERYGMTEIGMALSQPLDGPRQPGTVGAPLPGVEVRIVADELQVRGRGVLDGYWQRPDETREVFTEDGFFRTGDVAERLATPDGDIYRLLGRRSVDILKSGGEKISALEIEAVLRCHEAVADAAVVGRDDPEWGQRVVAFVELLAGASCEGDGLRNWCREHLAAFKVPKSVEIVDMLPRNALGKVVKGRLP